MSAPNISLILTIGTDLKTHQWTIFPRPVQSYNITLHNSTAPSLSPFEFWFQQIIASALSSSLSFLLHTLIVISICRIERIHNRFFVFLFFVSISRSLYSAGRIIAFIYRSLRTAGIVPSSTPWLICHSVQILLFGPQTLDLLLLLILVLDLILSFIYPNIYRNLTVKHAIKLSLGCVGFCVLTRLLPSYIHISFTKVVLCVDTYAVLSDGYASWARWLEFSLTMAILIAYIILWWTVRKKYFGPDANHVTVKRSIKLMPFIRSQLIGHVLFAVSSRTLKLVSDFLDENSLVRLRLTAIDTDLNCIGILADAIIFNYRHPKLWYSSLNMVCGEKVAKILSKWKGKTDQHVSNLSIVRRSGKVVPVECTGTIHVRQDKMEQ